MCHLCPRTCLIQTAIDASHIQDFPYTCSGALFNNFFTCKLGIIFGYVGMQQVIFYKPNRTHSPKETSHVSCLSRYKTEHKLLFFILIRSGPLTTCSAHINPLPFYHTYHKYLQIRLQMVYIISCLLRYKSNPYLCNAKIISFCSSQVLSPHAFPHESHTIPLYIS